LFEFIRIIGNSQCKKAKLEINAKVAQCAPASELYTSPRFKAALEYARTLTSENRIFVLSAKHGILPLDVEVEPYNKSLYDMNGTERYE
jgi:hypothetical protein